MSWIIQAVGGGVSAAGTVKGAKSDMRMLADEARIQNMQADRDEEAQRREGRQALGTMAASMAQAGGGGDAGVLGRSAVAAELDALNIRYAGRARAAGLMRDRRSIAKEAPYLAGAQLLSSAGSAYRTRASQQ
jgi:hypothetical protein